MRDVLTSSSIKAFLLCLLISSSRFVAADLSGASSLVNQLPGTPGPGVFRSALIVPVHPLCEIPGGTDIIAPVFFAFQDVDGERHKKGLSRLAGYRNGQGL